MVEYKKLKGDTYEEYVFNNLLSEYDNVYYFKETPEFVMAKTKLYENYDIYQKYKKCDIGADLVAIKNDKVYFIQCKNFSQTISINDFCSFYFLVLEYELNGIVYYNRNLSERLIDLATGKIKYYNLPFNNTILDINFINEKNNIIEPRDYQLEIYKYFKNIQRGIISLPCGMGKTYCSWLIGKDYNNIIIISPTRNLAETNLVQMYNYSQNTYNPILISMDGTRNYNEIKLLLKEKNIISSTYDSVDILNKILLKLKKNAIFIDEFHNLSKANLNNNENEIYKLMIDDNNKILFLSATPITNKNYKMIFGDNIFKYDWKKAIESKYICDFKIILPENNNELNIKAFNDFLTSIEYKNEDRELIIKCYFLLKGINYYGCNKTILYSFDINEANKYYDIIQWLKKILNTDVEANIINYKTSKINRINYMKNFKTNKNKQILINVQILNEGIDIPECDSVYITKPNENMVNLIQRMCRCNRVMLNKKIANIFIWGGEKDKYFTHLNKFINYEYFVEKYSPCAKIEIKKNDNESNFIKLLKKHTNIDEDFIDTFFKKFKIGGELDFDIEDINVAKFLGITLATLRNRLKNVYSKNKRFIERVDFIRVKSGNTSGVTFMLNYQCFEKLAMSGDSTNSEIVRNYFVKLREYMLLKINI